MTDFWKLQNATALFTYVLAAGSLVFYRVVVWKIATDKIISARFSKRRTVPTKRASLDSNCSSSPWRSPGITWFCRSKLGRSSTFRRAAGVFLCRRGYPVATLQAEGSPVQMMLPAVVALGVGGAGVPGGAQRQPNPDQLKQ